MSIYCPESRGDNTLLNGVDFGVNVFKPADSEYAADCYLRYSNHDGLPSTTLLQQWINPNKDMVVISHGWQPVFDGTHQVDEKWSHTLPAACVSGANIGETEPCPPKDHDAQYWHENGFNVLFLDWQYFSAEPNEVKNAERKLYDGAYVKQRHPDANGNDNVVQLLYAKLNELLDAAQWNGAELRLAGHSLGSQVVLNLAAAFKQDAGNAYKDKLKRVALLDHFFSRDGKDYLPQKDPNCWFWCSHYWTGEYARNVLLPIIRDANNVPVVIENYRSSPAAATPFVGDENVELIKQTVFVEMKPWYYGPEKMPEKHSAALVEYVHCMKFTGPLHANAPSCRMPTAELKSLYCPGDGSSKCLKRFAQKESAQAYTTWDLDNLYDVYNV